MENPELQNERMALYNKFRENSISVRNKSNLKSFRLIK